MWDQILLRDALQVGQRDLLEIPRVVSGVIQISGEKPVGPEVRGLSSHIRERRKLRREPLMLRLVQFLLRASRFRKSFQFAENRSLGRFNLFPIGVEAHHQLTGKGRGVGIGPHGMSKLLLLPDFTIEP